MHISLADDIDDAGAQEREANFKAIYGVKVLEIQQNNTFAREEKVKQVGKCPFGRFCWLVRREEGRKD